MSFDYLAFDVLLDHPRAALWELLGSPELYPRFFSGLTACELIPPAKRGEPKAYQFRAALPSGALSDYLLHLTTHRPEEKLVLSGTPDTGGWVSVDLADDRPGRTRVALVIFRPAIRHREERSWNKAEIRSWARDGLRRMGDYLAGVPNSAVANEGESASLHLSVAKLMIRSGVIAPARPDRAFRQLNALAKWGFTLAGGYRAAAARAPQHLAIADECATRTFAELDERTTRLAAALIDRGLGPGSKIAALARNHSAMVECMVASGKAGADLVLLNTGLATRQVEEIVEQHSVAALFADDEFHPVTQYLSADLPQFSTTSPTSLPERLTVEDAMRQAPDIAVRPPDKPGKLVVLTSGTSGTPKGARRPTPKGFGTIASMLSRIPLHAGERMLIAAPLFHSWGLAALQISTPLRATVVLQDRFDAQACLRAISVHRCTSLIAIPIMLRRILNLPKSVRTRYDTSSLRVVASSGSALSGSLVTEFMDTFGDILYNFYGSTEVSWAAVATPADLRRAPTTAGHPPLGTSMGILDEDGNPVARGAVGRIFVGNEMLFDGYTDGATAGIKDALMDTGDLGYLDADGRLFVSGRDDEMIISGGENVFPRPVEEALAALPQVSEVAVVGVPDPEYGQRLAAYIVLKDGARLDPGMVRNYIHHRLARYSVPREVTFLSRLPRNTTGKVLKRLLVERSG
ncbi:MAG: AMP-binding protein [Haloechinothrix sp.]